MPNPDLLRTYMAAGMGLFILLLAYLTYLGWRKTRTIADFAIAGEGLGPFLLGVSFAATFFSAATFVGLVGWSYQYGLSNLWAFIALAGASPIALILFARRVRHSNVTLGSLSLPDWLGAFYKSDLLRVGVALALLFNIFYIAAQFSGCARAFEVLFGLDYTSSVLLIAFIVTVYVMVGGTYADVYTDVAEGLLMAVMGAVIFLSVFWVFDKSGVEVFRSLEAELGAQSPQLIGIVNRHSEVYYSALAVCAFFVLEFAFSAQPQLFNKVLALKDPRGLRKMILTYVFLAVLFLGVIFGGFYLRILNPGLQQADQAIFVYVENYFPPLVAAFLGVVILAAALSTTDGLFVVLAVAISNDIFLKVLVKRGLIRMNQERAQLVSRYLAQFSTVAVGIVSVLIVLKPPPNLVLLFWFGAAGVTSATVAPVLLGIYLPNFVTRQGAIASLVTGLGSYLAAGQILVKSGVFVHGTLALLISFLVMMGVSALTQRKRDTGRADWRVRDSLGAPSIE
ncbi:MAG: sodium:solute symporter family protein [Acidobacteria bacterium]|nr:sodium:solute symporter family protein [Acidobacteriota bacterium]